MLRVEVGVGRGRRTQAPLLVEAVGADSELDDRSAQRKENWWKAASGGGEGVGVSATSPASPRPELCG